MKRGISLKEADRLFGCTSCERVWNVMLPIERPDRCPSCGVAKWPMISERKEDPDYYLRKLMNQRDPDHHQDPDRLF